MDMKCSLIYIRCKKAKFRIVGTIVLFDLHKKKGKSLYRYITYVHITAFAKIVSGRILKWEMRCSRVRVGLCHW